MSVINVKVSHIRPSGYQNLEEWISDPANVYIGRKGVVFIGAHRFPCEDSPWANPFKVGRDGTREEVIMKYRIHLEKKLKDPVCKEQFEQLRGKNLGCWCKPEKCHGDMILELLH